MGQIFLNNLRARLSADVLAADTAIPLAAGSGLPIWNSGDWMWVTLTQNGSETSWEIVKATQWSTDNLDVVERGQQGMAAADWVAGSKAQNRATAADMGGGVTLSDAEPLVPGEPQGDGAVGDPGVSTEASRADHRHPAQPVFISPRASAWGGYHNSVWIPGTRGAAGTIPKMFVSGAGSEDDNYVWQPSVFADQGWLAINDLRPQVRSVFYGTLSNWTIDGLGWIIGDPNLTTQVGLSWIPDDPILVVGYDVDGNIIATISGTVQTYISGDTEGIITIGSQTHSGDPWSSVSWAIGTVIPNGFTEPIHWGQIIGDLPNQLDLVQYLSDNYLASGGILELFADLSPTGNASKIIRLNATEDALEWLAMPDTSGAVAVWTGSGFSGSDDLKLENFGGGLTLHAQVKVGVFSDSSTNTGLWNTDGNFWTSGTVQADGDVSGANLSGTNTGDQDLSPYLLSATAASTYIPLSQKGAAGGVAPLDGGGKIASTYLPAIAITETFVVASQAAQLALTAQEGDVAVRSDESKCYIHNGGISGTMADWTYLQTPVAPVLSVNGQTGAVSLGYGDVGAQAASAILSDIAGLDTTGAALKVLRRNFGNTAYELATVSTAPRVHSQASAGSSITLDYTNYDVEKLTAQAANLTFNDPGGSPADATKLEVWVKDDGTTRTFTWNAAFAPGGVSLPAGTVPGKWIYLGFKYNSTAAKWHLVSASQEV